MALLFRKKQRLLKKQEFQTFFKTAVYTDHFLWRLYTTKKVDQQSKVAFIASKRVGNAFQRNTCKRRMRDLYRLKQNHLKTYRDYVFVLKSTLTKASIKTLETSWDQCLSRQGYLCP